MMRVVFFAPAAALALSACAATKPNIPTVVKVPVPVACEIEQVPVTVLPTVTASDVFSLAALALAQIDLLKAENTRLRAANSNPCPAE